MAADCIDQARQHPLHSDDISSAIVLREQPYHARLIVIVGVADDFIGIIAHSPEEHAGPISGPKIEDVSGKMSRTDARILIAVDKLPDQVDGRAFPPPAPLAAPGTITSGETNLPSAGS